MSKHPFAILVRWGAALGLGFVALRFLATATRSEYYLNAFTPCLYGFAALIGAVLLLGPELVAWAAIPVYRALNSIFFPAATGTPPVDYTLARFYRKRERYEESIEQYFKIVHYHPEELTAYLEGIETAFLAGEEESASKLYRLGMRRLHARDARQELARIYAASRTEKPSELSQGS